MNGAVVAVTLLSVRVENRGENEKFRGNDGKGHQKFRCEVVLLYL